MDLKSKLTSRKFWVALVGFVSMMLTYFFGKSESEVAQVSALIMAGASVVAYAGGRSGTVTMLTRMVCAKRSCIQASILRGSTCSLVLHSF